MISDQRKTYSDDIENQLRQQIAELRHENQTLRAQLSYHRKILEEMQMMLGAASQVNRKPRSRDALNSLMIENEQLKNVIKLQKLSNREREILQCIVDGKTSREIAELLQISKLTVDTHRKNIQHKLEVSNTVELIRVGMIARRE